MLKNRSRKLYVLISSESLFSVKNTGVVIIYKVTAILTLKIIKKFPKIGLHDAIKTHFKIPVQMAKSLLIYQVFFNIYDATLYAALSENQKLPTLRVLSTYRMSINENPTLFILNHSTLRRDPRRNKSRKFLPV